MLLARLFGSGSGFLLSIVLTEGSAISLVALTHQKESLEERLTGPSSFNSHITIADHFFGVGGDINHL